MCLPITLWNLFGLVWWNSTQEKEETGERKALSQFAVFQTSRSCQKLDESKATEWENTDGRDFLHYKVG